MIDPDHPALHRVRALCLALPDTSERLSHGTPTFFIGGKRAFLSLWDDHHHDGRLAIVCAAPLGVQETMVKADPERFYRPPYVGHLGWLGIRLDRDLSWDEVGRFIQDAHASVSAPRKKPAPKKPTPKRPARK